MIFQLDMFDLSESSLCPCYLSLNVVHYLCGYTSWTKFKLTEEVTDPNSVSTSFETYSASQLETERVDCFLEDQGTRFFPRKTNYS
jgi:hypothetical protein